MLEPRIGIDTPEAELKEFLENNCNKQEEYRYIRYYTADELDHLKTSLSELSINIDNLEEEKKKVSKGLNDALKGLKTSVKKVLKDLRTRSEEVTENCYVFIDDESRQIGYYNAKADLVGSRPMRPQEMPGPIFRQIHRSEPSMTGTDD